MRRIGLIGGASWLSTIEYYRLINLLVHEKLGGKDYARLSLDSINYGDLIRNNENKNQKANEQIIVDAAQRLAAADAEALVICANTLHMFAPAVESATGLPVIHIAKATALAVKTAGVKTVGLIGTKLLMGLDIYHTILEEQGTRWIVPEDSDKDRVNDSIFNELGRGEFTDKLRSDYLGVIERLRQRGAEGVILGCTEIPLLFAGYEIPLRSFDTTAIHSAAAVEFMLGS